MTLVRGETMDAEEEREGVNMKKETDNAKEDIEKEEIEKKKKKETTEEKEKENEEEKKNV